MGRMQSLYGRRAALTLGGGAVVGLLTGARAASAAAGTTVSVASPAGTPPLVPASAVANAVAFLNAMHDAYPGTLRIPQSYADEVRLGSASFTYDAGIAILAWLAHGSADSVERATEVGAALAYAQTHDPDVADGRLRRGYDAEGFVTTGGKVNVRFGQTVVGDLAVVGIGLVQLAKKTGRPAMGEAAVALGDWITGNCVNNKALGGFTVGVGAAGLRWPGLSTAHNADLVEFFRQLATLTGRSTWSDAAGHAEKFVRNMWMSGQRRFAVGSPDGRTVDDRTELLDAQTRPVLALGGRYSGAIRWAGKNLSVLDTAARTNSTLPPGLWFKGVTVSAASQAVPTADPIEPGLPRPDRQAVWFEGTAQFAAALRIVPDLHDLLTAGFSVAALASAQLALGRGQHVNGRPLPAKSGVVAASSPLHIGTEPSGYYPVRHVGATGWLLLGGLTRHPWRPVLTP